MIFHHPVRFILGLAAAFAATTVVSAQVQRPGPAQTNYAQYCANCHGDKLQGGLAPSMLDDVWLHGGEDESLAKSIHTGFPEKGMPPWAQVFSDKDIRALVIYIREQRAKFQASQSLVAAPADDLTVKSQLHSFQLHTWVDSLDEPWSLAFLGKDKALVTEKGGRLFEIVLGKRAEKPVRNLPEVDTNSQAGLFDVVPHPDYAKNGWIYLAYSHPQKNAEGKRVSLTRVIRGRIVDGAWTDQQVIFQAPVEQYPGAGGVHFGGRLAFDHAGYLYFTIGERGRGANAQELDKPMGKVHRVFDDGRIPEDNPFVNQPGAAPTIWSYGHRNPQGLAVHPVTGELYDVEHGPRGGDEVNWVRKGRNYGWPIITFGMDYDGRAITDITSKEGMEQPVTYWVPSIAPCGANFYTGDLFPKWKHQLFVSSLAAQELHRLEIVGDKKVSEEVLFKGLGRIRDVITGPDGALYVLLQKRIARITPAE